ncbi:MAG: TlpA disulfide reductase family protein, partial [Gemmatimonadaceae bacterium]
FIYQQPRPGVSSAAGPSSPSVPPTPVLSDGGPATHGIPGYVPLCLTVRGTRLSSSGPVAPQPASASVCGYSSFPIVGGFGLATAGFIPMVALTQPSPEGMVEVTGHAAAATATSGAPTPNLLVHFAGEPNADMVGILTQALGESGRRDAATAVLAVVGKEQLPNTTYIPGVVYAEQDAGAWERVFDLKGAQRSVTMIVGPNRDVLWKHEGNVDRRTLAEALRKSLVLAAPVSVGMLRSSVRIGHAPPNFLFEYAPGRNLTLRKLAGRPVALVFWKSSSQPSIEAVRELQHELVRNKAAKEMVLAINDGDTAETAQKTAAENNLSATVVSDPDRKISSAYGINIWPTILSIGASGLVSGVSYGRTDAHRSETATHGMPRSNVR